MLSGILFIFAPLVAGYACLVKNETALTWLNKMTLSLIFVILFVMGLSLAALENLMGNFKVILQVTMVFFLAIGICNLLVLPWVDRWRPLNNQSSKNKLPLSSLTLESLKLVAIVAAGFVLGLMMNTRSSWLETASEWILFILLFCIGVQLRNSGLSLKQILLNKHGMIIASLVIVSSWLGGIIAAFLLDIPIYQALAMASGFGWYSLSGILMGDAFGPVYGGASFLIELLRELVALVLIPLLIRQQPSTAIGYAGATAMDFTLPIIQTSGGVRCVPIAIVSGFILSLLVPVFMLLFVTLANH